MRRSARGERGVAAVRGVRAFSLFEAMVALVLVVGMSGAVMTFLFNLGRQRESLDRETGGLRGGAAFIEALEGDLAGVVAGVARSGAGVSGTETSLTLLTRGVAPPDLRGGRASVAGDLQGVSYGFDASGGTVTARRWSVQAAGGVEAGQEGTVIAEGVARVRLRYFDGSVWAGSFDSSSQGGLPVAVEVAVWFGTPGEEIDGRTAGGATGEVMDGDDGLEGRDRDGMPATLEDLEGGGFDETLPESDAPLPTPDRVRIIVIPDGPVASWRDGA